MVPTFKRKSILILPITNIANLKLWHIHLDLEKVTYVRSRKIELFVELVAAVLTGGCCKWRALTSLWTAPVHPLPTNITPSCSLAFTALRTISLQHKCESILQYSGEKA